MILALTVLPARAEIGCPASPAAAATTAQGAAEAFTQMDSPGFERARLALGEQLGCLSAAPEPRQAATIHLVEALAAFKAKDPARTAAALQAMHESDPSLALPETLAPPGGPLSRRDAEARALPPATRAPHGLSLDVVVDGRPAPDLPASRPALVVVLGADGQVLWSGLLPAGQRIPPLIQPGVEVLTNTRDTTEEARTLATTPPVRDRSASARAARPWFLAAGGGAVAAGVLGALTAWQGSRTIRAGELVASNATGDEWEGAFGRTLSRDDIYAIHDQTVGLGAGALVVGGAAVGLGAVGAVVRW